MIFKLGQRVKLVRRKGFKLEGSKMRGQAIELGSEGTIIEMPPKLPIRGTTFIANCVIKFDCSPFKRGCMFYQLEPIQPERNKVVAWSECLWQPEKEEVM